MADRLLDPAPAERIGDEPFRVQFADGRMGNLWSRPGSTMDWDSLRYPPHHPERNPLVGCVIVTTTDDAGTERNYAFGRGVVVELPRSTGDGKFVGSDYYYETIEYAFKGDDPTPVTIGEPWGPGAETGEKAVVVLEDTEKVTGMGAVPVDWTFEVSNPFDSAKGFINHAVARTTPGSPG